MLNSSDILETIKMIQEENLDIRTITMGISLLDCIDSDIDKACNKVYDKIMRKAENLVKTGEDIEKQYGIPIVNKRISVTPIAMVSAACKGSPVKFAKALQRAADGTGVNYLGGYSALVHKGFSAGDLELIQSIPEALAETSNVCSSVNIGSTRAGINMDAVAMMGQVIGNLPNVILDPIMILVFGWNIAGAAIATTIGNILASLYFVWYFLKKSRQLSILPKDFTLRERISGRVCAIGLPTAIFSALMSVSTIVINQILVKYGNAPVAAIGIVFKANMFITFLQMGLANGVQPLLGYSYGAGNISRFREVERFTKICCLVTGITATVLYFIGREPIIRMFISDDEVVYYGVKMLVAYMISGPVIGMLFVNMNCMQSVNHSLPATILSVMRQGVLLIPLLYVLQFFWGMEGVIYGQSITDYIAVFLSAVLWRNIRKKL